MITRNTPIDYMPDFNDGEMILIDKPFKKTSFDMVYKVRKATGVKKVGHTGTLDPMATGLLIICTGRATKEISGVQVADKTYTGIISLGKTTPSFDLETEFDSEKSYKEITEESVLEVRDSFLGKIRQTPPMFSAVKHKGKSLYKFARKGVEIVREPREIVLSQFDIIGIDLPDVHFQINCSTGTYVRVIAHDFGGKLGCGAYLKNLRRTKIGSLNVDNALTIDEFLEYVNKNKIILNSEKN